MDARKARERSADGMSDDGDNAESAKVFSDPEWDCSLYHGDCNKTLCELQGRIAFDSIVTDAPYGIGIVQQCFDTFKSRIDALTEGQSYYDEMRRVFSAVLDCCKPGAHLLCFGGTRTYHRLVCAIEDAGWEIRDQLAFVHGQGFPHSFNISKAIDKHLGAERKVVGYATNGTSTPSVTMNHGHADRTGHANGGGRRYAVTEAATEEAKRYDGFGTQLKPAFEPIVLARKPIEGTLANNILKYGTGALNLGECRIKDAKTGEERFAANFMHDGSEAVLSAFPNESAARFFYCAKPTAKEKGEGNVHPTVKSIALMEYLIKLVTSRGQTVLDPFMGSGTTGVAALRLGRKFVGIEREDEYFKIAYRRVEEAHSQPTQLPLI